MPLVAIFIGSLMLIAGVRNTHTDLANLWGEQLTGERSFLGWMFALVLVGSFGYVRELRPLSRAFLVLVLVVILLSNSQGESVLARLQRDVFQAPQRALTEGQNG